MEDEARLSSPMWGVSLKELFYLGVWMANNIAVTLSNKAIFANVDFKYPYALTTVHMACNILGSQLYFMFNDSTKPKYIEGKNRYPIFLFSIFFAMNIAIGNMSLRWVSVNFNQVMRALVPAIVMLISMLFFGKNYSSSRKWAVLPIVFGVALTFYGDMQFTATGLFYTLLCIILAALKAVMSGELLTGDLKLHPIDLINKMCPLALIQTAFLSVLTGEAISIANRWDEIFFSNVPRVLLLSGFLSFTLNVSSFVANQQTSPLTLCIAANVKQVLLVVFGTLYFGDTVGLLNGIGIIVVLVGSFKYSLVSLQES